MYKVLTKDDMLRDGYFFNPRLIETQKTKYYILQKNGKFQKLYNYKHNNGTHRNHLTYKYKGGNRSAAKLVYTWFVGPVPQGMDVIPKDNNIYNLSIDNLKLVSHRVACALKWKEVLEETCDNVLE